MLTVKQLEYMERRVLEWNVIFGNNLDDESLIPTYINLCIEEGKEYVNASQKALELFEENCKTFPHMRENTTLLKRLEHSERIDALVDSVFTGFMLNRLSAGSGFGAWFSYDFKCGNYCFEDCLGELIGRVPSVGSYSNLLLSVLKEESVRYDIFGAFQRVTESNFSKAAPKTVDVAEEIDYITSQRRYVDVFAEESGDYIIFKAKRDLQEGNFFEKGKIVKWSGFRSVEDLGGLEQFIY